MSKVCVDMEKEIQSRIRSLKQEYKDVIEAVEFSKNVYAHLIVGIDIHGNISKPIYMNMDTDDLKDVARVIMNHAKHLEHSHENTIE